MTLRLKGLCAAAVIGILVLLAAGGKLYITQNDTYDQGTVTASTMVSKGSGSSVIAKATATIKTDHHDTTHVVFKDDLPNIGDRITIHRSGSNWTRANPLAQALEHPSTNWTLGVLGIICLLLAISSLRLPTQGTLPRGEDQDKDAGRDSSAAESSKAST